MWFLKAGLGIAPCALRQLASKHTVWPNVERGPRWASTSRSPMCAGSCIGLFDERCKVLRCVPSGRADGSYRTPTRDSDSFGNARRNRTVWLDVPQTNEPLEPEAVLTEDLVSTPLVAASGGAAIAAVPAAVLEMIAEGQGEARAKARSMPAKPMNEKVGNHNLTTVVCWKLVSLLCRHTSSKATT